MILAADIGNTTTALTGLERRGNDYEAVFSRKVLSESGLSEQLKRALGGVSGIERAAVSSVVPELTEPVSRAVEEAVGQAPVLISAERYRGILKIAVPEPQRLGSDRIADSAWAAYAYPLPAVTVDVGTATTFNVIGNGGVFLGGIICAGIRTSLDALSRRTAQLPEIAPVMPERLIGTNTVECMLSGAVIGTAAMIDGLTARIESELGSAVTLILTGGGAAFADPLCGHCHILEPHMLAKGIALAVN